MFASPTVGSGHGSGDPNLLSVQGDVEAPSVQAAACLASVVGQVPESLQHFPGQVVKEGGADLHLLSV